LVCCIFDTLINLNSSPVQDVVDSCRTYAATNVILGLLWVTNQSLSQFLLVCLVSSLASTFSAMYGGVVCALGMLSTITICLTIDAYGPINDNAGGIAEMARMIHRICKRTDALDVARNTIAAFGKVDYMLVLSEIHVVAQ
jgi:H+-translocating diphosphatase